MRINLKALLCSALMAAAFLAPLSASAQVPPPPTKVSTKTFVRIKPRLTALGFPKTKFRDIASVQMTNGRGVIVFSDGSRAQYNKNFWFGHLPPFVVHSLLTDLKGLLLSTVQQQGLGAVFEGNGRFTPGFTSALANKLLAVDPNIVERLNLTPEALVSVYDTLRDNHIVMDVDAMMTQINEAIADLYAWGAVYGGAAVESVCGPEGSGTHTTYGNGATTTAWDSGLVEYSYPTEDGSWGYSSTRDSDFDGVPDFKDSDDDNDGREDYSWGEWFDGLWDSIWDRTEGRFPMIRLVQSLYLDRLSFPSYQGLATQLFEGQLQPGPFIQSMNMQIANKLYANPAWVNAVSIRVMTAYPQPPK